MEKYKVLLVAWELQDLVLQDDVMLCYAMCGMRHEIYICLNAIQAAVLH